LDVGRLGGFDPSPLAERREGGVGHDRFKSVSGRPKRADLFSCLTSKRSALWGESIPDRLRVSKHTRVNWTSALDNIFR